MDHGVRRFSFAQLSDFVRCPKLYRLKHVLKQRPSRVRVWRHLVVGGLIHNTLRDCFKELPPEQRTAAGLEAALRERWRKHPQRHQAFASPEEERSAGLAAIGALRWFARQEELLRAPLGVEAECRASLEPGVELAGRLDRVDAGDDGTISVTDYKTGRMPDHFDAEQLQIYALLASETYGRPVRLARYLYLEDGKDRTYVPAAADLEAVRESARRLVLRIDSVPEFPAQPSRLCRYCDYLADCPEGSDAEAQRWRPQDDAVPAG